MKKWHKLIKHEGSEDIPKIKKNYFGEEFLINYFQIVLRSTLDTTQLGWVFI